MPSSRVRVSGDRDALVCQAREQFAARLGRAPSICVAAPGRVNLIGEHTDYNDGLVLPFAIDRWTIIAAGTSNAPVSTFIAKDLGEEARFDLRQPPASGDPIEPPFARYLLGVASGFHARGCALTNIDALITSTIPIGAGLSSSAALEVAFARVLEVLTGDRLDHLERARLCRQAEHEYAHTPCGIMDVLTISRATAGAALLIDCRSLAIREAPLPKPEDAALLVIDTGVKHDLASSAYAARRAECERIATRLGTASLREADAATIARAGLSPTERRRAEHVLQENQRVLDAAAALEAGKPARLGRLMFASHDSLRDRYEVSCAELDAIVESARGMRQAGVFGARMTGGGFGGCAIVLSRADAADAVAERIARDFADCFGRAPAVIRARSVDGAACMNDL